MTLDGKRIVVLGGSSGIGLATAKAAAKEGASVVIASSRKARIDDALAKLPAGTEGVVLDLADEAAVQALFASLGGFDHLVFTAGETLQLGSLTSTDVEAARRFFGLRYWGAYLAAKYGSGSIPPGGSIVFPPRPGREAPSRRLGVRGEHLLRYGGADARPGGQAGADPRQHRLSRRGEEPTMG